MREMMEEFIGKEVKVTFRDGENLKIARGILADYSDGLVKVSGSRGILIISSSSIQKMSLRGAT